nr:DUF4439 domain-containing protein [Auraticoccus cholistanensis]
MADVVVALNQAAHAYELALVPLALGGDARAAAEDRLQRLLALRDAVSRVLAERGRAVPAAEPGYDVELDPDDGAGSAALRRRVETGLLPWLGRWVQASGEAERRLAVDALVAATRSGTRLGAELAVWPGW